jgi:hypothetical protein
MASTGCRLAYVTRYSPVANGLGTFEGAVACNGNLYCPQVPKALLELGVLPRGATPEQVADHGPGATAWTTRRLLPRAAGR